MSKRAAEERGEDIQGPKGRRKSLSNHNDTADAQLDSDSEAEFEDEWDSEEEVFEAGEDGEPDSEKKDTMDVDQDTFMIGRDKLEAGQHLAPDLSTYDMLHNMGTTWPCLSFDILKDNLGDDRKTYPATIYAVAGTQAESSRAWQNEVLVMKLSGLSRVNRDRDDDSDDSDSDEEFEPILESKSLPIGSTINRIRAHALPVSNAAEKPAILTAAMTEDAELVIHNIAPHVRSFDHPGTVITQQQSKPLASLKMHRTEGYAVAWSPLMEQGKVLSGDNDGKIFATTCSDGGKWVSDNRPFVGHRSSVEDIQWSPNERHVFASASSDGTVKIWDARSKSRKPAVDVTVSDTDVNVLSWSGLTTHLLATGADDGVWACWDLRQWKPTAAGSAVSNRPSPVASFNFHKEQITSIEWHPTDDSIVAVAAGDNLVTLWDLSVELDDEESQYTAGVQDVPPQFLFSHYMEQVKECHWHPQIPGCIMATGMGSEAQQQGGSFGVSSGVQEANLLPSQAKLRGVPPCVTQMISNVSTMLELWIAEAEPQPRTIMQSATNLRLRCDLGKYGDKRFLDRAIFYELFWWDLYLQPSRLIGDGYLDRAPWLIGAPHAETEGRPRAGAGWGNVLMTAIEAFTEVSGIPTDDQRQRRI